MNNDSKATTDLSRTHRRKLAMNRRATLLLAIGAGVGLATQSSRVRAESGTTESDRSMSATPTETGGLRNPKTASAPQFQNLKAVGSEHQVVTIHHHRNTFEIMTADGRNAVFADADLRLKIDSSDNGPSSGKPVILPGGMMGDRATVFFASPVEISDLIRHAG